MSKIKENKGYLLAGVIGGLTATLCCIAPVVLVLLGFGTAIAMAYMHQFHIVSVVSGIIFMLLLCLYLVKRKEGVCNVNTIKGQWKPILVTIVIMVISLYAINFLLVKPVAAAVYGNLDVQQRPTGNLAEILESHGMTGAAVIEVVPEKEGVKELKAEIKGLFCGSCGPAIEYDVRSVTGVQSVESSGNIMTIIYDSDITSQDVVLSAVHNPYKAEVISVQQI